jgi:REP element-mobilizing transposase RayT
MARPLRVEFPGAVYHVTARGDGREVIFMDDADRRLFLAVVEHVLDRLTWRCHAYCLMGNHYHLLAETLTANLAGGMRQLNGLYTQRFNRRHKRVGHVFQGRYQAIVVQKDRHLLELCRYVVLNPVRAHMVEDVGAWPWSSYRVTVGQQAGPTRTGDVARLFRLPKIVYPSLPHCSAPSDAASWCKQWGPAGANLADGAASEAAPSARQERGDAQQVGGRRHCVSLMVDPR